MLLSRPLCLTENRMSAATPPATPPVTPPVLLFSCMKNEGPGLLEWIAYHRAIGIDHFLIYSNDCEDGTDAMLDRLQELGLVTHRRNPSPKGRNTRAQALAIDQLADDPVYRAAPWVLFIDADEFLNIHRGAGSLADLFAADPAADCFLIHWRLFGTSGRHRFEPGLVTEQFTQAIALSHRAVPGSFAPKALFRTSAFLKPGIHRPRQRADLPTARHVYADGTPASRGWGRIEAAASFDHAQINHYSVQSLDMVILKYLRGFAAGKAPPDPLSYLQCRDFNHEADLRIQRHLPALRAERDRLLADPILGPLQKSAEDWRLATLARQVWHPRNRPLIDSMLAALQTMQPQA